MKSAKIYKLEEKLVTLKNIKCSPEIKRRLRKAAIDWINYINQHIRDIHRHGFVSYHNGEIAILELFFNIPDKNEKTKNLEKT